MKIGFSLILILGLAVPLFTQTIAPQAPGLIVENDSKKEPLEITPFSANVTINGFIAETTMTMTFYNPHQRQLEGDFVFPLPEGSFVSGYALDINGVMVDGVVVEKQEGRVVFEKIVRKGIDPGLVEWVEGNNFRTRVFPIPPTGGRTISVRYLSEISFKNRQPYYYLPLPFKKAIKEFALKIEVVQTGQKPVITKGKPANFDFDKWQSGYRAETSIKNYEPAEDLIIALPGSVEKGATVEKSSEGDYYFCARDWVDSHAKTEYANRIEPDRITILWDTSGSMEKYDHKKELQLLKAYFSGLKSKEIYVDLVLFHQQQEKPRRFKIYRNNIDTLIKAIENLDYDGGTALASMTPPNRGQAPDIYLLFSDGAGNFGKDEPTGFKAPVYAFSASSTSNHQFLIHLARKSGGAYFNLNQMDRETVCRNIGAAPYSFISYTVNNGTVSEIYPQPPIPVYDRNVIVGKLLSPKAKITLNYGIKGRVMKQVSFELSQDEAENGNRLRTYWAQEKIGELQIFPKRNYKELVETGKKYGLVTPGTSLIVLDNINQYLEFKITPPESLPKMREEYFGLVKQREEDTRKKQLEKLEHVVEMWKERIEWWNTTYPLPVREPEKPKPPVTPPSPPTPEPPVTPAAPPVINKNCIGCIVGRIELQDGSSIPGAIVTLTGKNLKDSFKTVSDYQGEFQFSNIPAGVYTLKTELEGFKTIIINDVNHAQGGHTNVSIIIETIPLMEEVTVTGRTPTPVDSHSTAMIVAAEGAEDSSGEPEISLKEWDPATSYMEKLKNVGAEKTYNVYLEQKKEYGNAPSFYLDFADFFIKSGQKETALRILSNIAEMDIDNPALLRVLGYRLYQLKYLELSAYIFEKVLELRPEEPQSYRDLALVLAEQEQFDKAVDLLYHVVTNPWDRFEGVEITALTEINTIFRKAGESGVKELEKKIDPRLVKLLDMDIRIVLTWDTDQTDMDLWVTDPGGEKCFYSNKKSKIGGILPIDYTQGYGPEEFLLKKAIKGEYKIEVGFYSKFGFKLLGPPMIQVDIFTDYGRKSEKRKSITLRIESEKESISAGRIFFGH